MRKIRIFEHISLDGVIQVSSDPDGNVSYGDWSVPYRSPAGLAKGIEESNRRQAERGDEVCRHPQTGDPRLGSFRGDWTGRHQRRSRHQGKGWRRRTPGGQFDAHFHAARAWPCG